MDECSRIAGAIGDDAAVSCSRLAEAAVLERQVAQELERIIAPGAAECLIDDAPQEREIALLLTLAKPALGHGVDPLAVDRAGLGRQFRDRLVTVPAVVDVKHKFIGRGDAGFVRGERGNAVAELLDHLLIHLDRFGPLLAAHVVCRVQEVLRGRDAPVRIKRGRASIRPLGKRRSRQNQG